MTSDAVLGWKHSRTGTVHLAMVHDQARVEHESLGTVGRAPCGAHGPHHHTGQVEVHPDSNYMVNTWAMDEIPEVDWVPAFKVTCKTCRSLASLPENPEQLLLAIGVTGFSLKAREWLRKQARAWTRTPFACLVGECGPGDESTCLDCAPLKNFKP